jgi:hypothetical protein
MTINEIESRIVELIDDKDVSAHQLLELDDNLQFMFERLKNVRDKLKALFITHIQENGPIINGTIRYFVDDDRETKCTHVPRTIEAILTKSGIDDLIACLSSQPFKPATTIRFLGDSVGDLFETIVLSKLKRDGTERSRLQKIDSKYQNAA